MKDSHLPLKSSAQAEFLRFYQRSLGIYIAIIIRFGAEIGYKGPRNILILSENQASAMNNPYIIDRKIEKDF